MTPLHEAVGSEAAVPEVIRTMVDVIVKANNWSLVDAVDNAGNTALHVAARRGRPDVIPELAALNPKTRNLDGDTPFHLAARAGHPYCFEAMLQVGTIITNDLTPDSCVTNTTAGENAACKFHPTDARGRGSRSCRCSLGPTLQSGPQSF